jgi:hypothetical protein
LTWKKAILGLTAGLITVLIFMIDRLDYFSTNHDIVLSYSLSLPVLFLIGILSLITGLKHEHKAILTYIGAMILYDVVTNDTPTVLIAGISSVLYTVGVITSIIASWIQDVT